MTTSAPRDEFRLPDAIRPERYELHLVPNLEEATFTGTAVIEVEVVAETDVVVLNANELQVSDAALRAGWASTGDAHAGEATRPLSIEADPEHEMVELSPGARIAPGPYTLVCRFSGELNDKLCGFYRSTFTDDSGFERTIATTQFEETDARRAFPCFDEPAYKAVFSVTLDVAPGLLAISNGPEIGRETLEDGHVRVRFGDTVKMSTYLVAFVVGPLVATAPVDVDGIAVRVVHVPGKERLTRPAIDAAAHALRFYAEYFALPYPGEKCDLVAVPDFAAGAMENLGCITFREAILLADPEDTARSELQRLTEVVEHELAHMWFGDLVTMRWWNGIWLNEAFATFMALCCQDDYHPEWETFVDFSRSKSAALGVDGLHSTRPVEYPVVHPEEAAAMFDVLTYEKGAGVLWMLESYLGRSRFRAGVRRYLKANQFGNTETTDLWDAIEAEAKEPVREVMDSWIFQGGYPLVRASRKAKGGKVALTEEPFAYLRTVEPGGESAIGRDWIVPIIARPLGKKKEERLLLDHKGAELDAAEGPLVVNSGGAGFYRLSYDAALQGELVEHYDELAAGERYNLVADGWAVALSGRGELSGFLSLVGHLGAERDPNVWSIVIGALALLDLVCKEEDRETLSGFTRRLLGPVLEEVGFEPKKGEEEQTPLLRSSLIAALGTLGTDPLVLSRSRALFAADHGGAAAVPADLAAAVLAVVAAHATRPEFEAILERYRRPDSPADEIRHLNCLANLRNAALAAEVRELCRTEIRSQNAPYLLAGLLRSREGGPATFAFITEHFAELTARFPDNSIHRMLDGLAGLVALDERGRPQLLAEAKAFVDRNVIGPRHRLVAQSLERLQVNVNFGQAVRGGLALTLGATVG
ncbi:MAG TPA: M1 family metallopeptidase [Acidimicrobiales bacterium]|nr:M1 family metallopeptidase [Acidimicrobiales bacterium]